MEYYKYDQRLLESIIVGTMMYSKLLIDKRRVYRDFLVTIARVMVLLCNRSILIYVESCFF